MYGLQVNRYLPSHGTIQYSESTSILRVSGSQIIDETTGLEVKLRGFDLWSNDWGYGFGDREPYSKSRPESATTQDQLDQIRRWGFNVIKLEVYWTGTRGPVERWEDRPQDYTYVCSIIEEGYSGLDIWLELIRMAREADLYVIVSVLVCFDPDWSGLEQYDHFGWSTHDYVVFNELDDAGQHGLERFGRYLEWLTEQVSGEPNVVAIEPWHFPYHRQDPWPDQARIDKYFSDVVPVMISSVRNKTDKMIIISPPGQGWFNYSNHPGQFDDPNIIYGSGGYGDYHVFGPWEPDWDYGALRYPHPSWIDFQNTYSVPIMSTEGPGIAQHAWEGAVPQDRLDLFEATITHMDAMNGWINHLYGCPNSEWGILESYDPNDTSSEGVVVEILKRHIP